MLISLVLLLLLQDTAPVQPPPEILGPYVERQDQGQATRVVLKNGLTVIVREEHAVPLAAITTLVKSGYLNEDDRTAGISRILARMYFQETQRRPRDEIFRETKALGGVLKSFTSYEHTVYQTVVPAESLLPALDLQADALWNASFQAAGLGRAVEQVLEADRQRLDEPETLTREKLYETAFEGHGIGRTPAPPPENLRALTLDDVLGYYQRYYQPGNVILSVVGPFDRESVLEQVVRLYGNREKTSAELTPLYAEVAQSGFRYTWRRGPVHLTHLALGYHTPGALSDDAAALEVLAAVLGKGRSSRFHEDLRDQKHLISTGTGSFHAYKNSGFLELTVETSSPLEASAAILIEIENIKKFGLTSEAIGRARAVLAGEYLRKLETREGIGEDLAYSEAMGDWQRSASYLERLQRVTPQRVTDAAKKYLTFSNLSVFEYLPDSIERYFTVADYQSRVLDQVLADSRQPQNREIPLTFQIPPLTDGLVADIAGEIQRRSILRGPDVYIREDHRLPLVTFGIFFPGGRLFESADNAGITELMLRTALRGTRNFDSSEIAKRTEGAGIQLQTVNEPDFFGYLLTGISGRMDRALQVLVEILQEPAFEEPIVDGERSIQLDRIRSLPDESRLFAENVFMESLFGDLPYGRTALGTEDSVTRLKGTDLREWFRTNQRKVLPTIFIIGDTRGTALVAPIADALTNEDLEPRDIAAMPRVQVTGAAPEIVKETNHEQTVMVYGFPGANRSATDRVLLQLVREMVSGMDGRDFHEAILNGRVPGATVETENVSYSRGGAVYTVATFPPALEADVRTALDEAYGNLRSANLAADDFRELKNYASGLQNISLQTQEAQMLEYARAVYAGAGVASVGRYSTAVQAVTSEQLRAVIAKYLNQESLRVATVRGGKR